MNTVMLIYPPGKAYQRSEDRAQSNIDDSAASSVHACNDIGYAAAILRNAGYNVFLRDYQRKDPRPFLRKGIESVAIPSFRPENKGQHHKCHHPF